MTGLVRVRAKVIVDNTGALTVIPLLLGPNGVVLPLLKYLVAHRHCRSLAWCERLSMGVELLLNYTDANREAFASAEALFRGFAQALYDGTVDPETGLDHSCLYWHSRRTKNANVILSMLTEFSDDLVKQGLARPLNPPDLIPGRYELMLAMATYEHRRSRAFFGHLRASCYEANPIVRATLKRRVPKIENDDRPPSFPEDFFETLLLHGFVRRGHAGHSDPLRRINARDALITLLMHGGGLRISECFHLWVHDVQIHPADPAQAVVRIYHPSEGAAPEDWCDVDGKLARNRADYLAGRYKRVPRHQCVGQEFAGWKCNLLDSSRTHSMTVTWRSASYGQVFLTLWRLWLAERITFDCFHPYAFISTKKGQRYGRAPGRPYSIVAFKQAHKRAIERIGLAASKVNGTTPHGHRHAMGQYLTEIEIPPAGIQKILHHTSLTSQEPYTRISQFKASGMLTAAQVRIASKDVAAKSMSVPCADLSQLFGSGFTDLDLDSLISGASLKLPRIHRGSI